MTTSNITGVTTIFDDMDDGTAVRVRDNDETYFYVKQDSRSATEPYQLLSEAGELHVISHAEAYSQGWYRAAHVHAAPEILRVARALLSSRKQVVAREAEIESYRTDLVKLNCAMNEHADEKDFCSDYESFIENMNNSLKVVRLQGRSRPYDVTVEITVTYRTTIAVNDPEVYTGLQAEEFVDNMSDSALYDETDDATWESVEVSVKDIERSS